ncbi:MAG TPA: diphosphomevalonate decarboxylase [Bacteroidetes bacterium]|nr:diphosphomevalonate decarboxylase [Bacteroidota bacterium]
MIMPWKNISWESPSNIAVIKYWGKYGNQLPMNPSLSMTLSNSVTRLHLYYRPAQRKPSFAFRFAGKEKPEFGQRIRDYLKRLETELPFLPGLDIRIDTENTFPHSAGIASSASSMSALALALADLERMFRPKNPEEEFLPGASRLARLASGSACRSVYPGWVEWGYDPAVQGSSDEYAVPLNHRVHPRYQTLFDAVLIVDPGRKKISSSAGHLAMNTHPFRDARIEQARENMGNLLKSLQRNHRKSFRTITESEALTLHALMMSARSGFSLLHPRTLLIMEKIRQKREQNGWDMCFTLDAGPNVHLLYPEHERAQVKAFIHDELAGFCEEGQWIDDVTGRGPVKLA